MAAASYFDGHSSQRHAASVRLEGSDLVIDAENAIRARWPLAAIRILDQEAEFLRLSCSEAPDLARLEVTDPETRRLILSHEAAENFASHFKRGEAAKLIGITMLAAASLVAATLALMPLIAEQLAPLVPPWLEKRIGEGVYKQVQFLFGGDKVCSDSSEEGAKNRALTALSEKLRLAADFEPGALRLSVLKSPVVNALALPGGHIIILNSLITKAETADELAGIIAHEMGHQAHRDSMRTLIEQGGTGFILGTVLGDFSGGAAILFASKQLVAASHSREAERQADAFAAETMRKLGRSAVPLGKFLVRLTDGQPDLGILASHPASPDRLAAIEAQSAANSGPALLSNEDWAALKKICD